MHLEKTETPMNLSFQLFYEQIRQAHEIEQQISDGRLSGYAESMELEGNE